MNNKTMKRLIPVIIVVVIAIVISLVFVLNREDPKEYDNKLEQAQKYVEEMDYKRAETAYLEAIDIDSKQTKAYVELADVYIADGKEEKALNILDKGIKNVDKEKQKEIKDKLNKYQNEGTMYKEYAKIVSKYLKVNNDENIEENFDMYEEDINFEYLLSLIHEYSDANDALFSLYDINEDGVPELLIGFAYDTDLIDVYGAYYFYDAYTFSNGKVYQLMDDIGGRTGSFILCENGIIKDQSSGGALYSYFEFYTLPKNGKELKLVDNIEFEEDTYYHTSENKTQISAEEFDDILKQYKEIDISSYKMTQENIDQCEKGKLANCKIL